MTMMAHRTLLAQRVIPPALSLSQPYTTKLGSFSGPSGLRGLGDKNITGIFERKTWMHVRSDHAEDDEEISTNTAY